MDDIAMMPGDTIALDFFAHMPRDNELYEQPTTRAMLRFRAARTPPPVSTAAARPFIADESFSLPHTSAAAATFSLLCSAPAPGTCTWGDITRSRFPLKLRVARRHAIFAHLHYTTTPPPVIFLIRHG